ncbi:MAG TPA: hypothetical protein VLC95_03625, partial [Anaerolineae bacterium]|nr:hypothetical protein [Anaerolineae bacterium]
MMADRRRWQAWIAVALIVVVAGAGLAAARLAKPAAIPHTDVNPYGANFFLDREVEGWKQEKTLEMSRAAWIGWVNQQFSWEEIEPQRKGAFEWAKHDRIVDLAERYG